MLRDERQEMLEMEGAPPERAPRAPKTQSEMERASRLRRRLRSGARLAPSQKAWLARYDETRRGGAPRVRPTHAIDDIIAAVCAVTRLTRADLRKGRAARAPRFHETARRLLASVMRRQGYKLQDICRTIGVRFQTASAMARRAQAEVARGGELAELHGRVVRRLAGIDMPTPTYDRGGRVLVDGDKYMLEVTVGSPLWHVIDAWSEQQDLLGLHSHHRQRRFEDEVCDDLDGGRQ